MKKRVLFFWLLIFTSVAQGQDSAPPPPEAEVQEYYLFSVPRLPQIGSAFVSWFFLRQGHLWQNNAAQDLNAIAWPQWDPRQIPITIVPAAKQPARLVLLDANKNVIEEVEILSAFSPEEYAKKKKLSPTFYQIKTSFNGEHATLWSPVYPWHSKRSIARCEVDMSDDDFVLAKSSKMKLCLQTLNSYFSDSYQDPRQLYVNISWPIVKGRENITTASGLERELRATARKKGAVFIAEKQRGKIFTADIGLTQVEILPKIQMVLPFADHQGAVLSPSTKDVKRVIHDITQTDGSRLQIQAFYSDNSEDRKFLSPALGQYRVLLQLTDKVGAATNDTEILTQQTQGYEQRTGLLGVMRAWQIMGSGSYNFLTSNRGETSQFLALPRLDLKFVTPQWGLQPYFSFEKTILTLGSTLEITELRAGLAKSLPWLQGLFVTAGYLDYALSGTNPGSTRLGSVEAISLGAGLSRRIEDWFVQPQFNLLFAEVESFDFRVDLGKMMHLWGQNNYYLGGFLGYSNYRANIVNKINILESFTETRMQVGVQIGWLGSDSYLK